MIDTITSAACWKNSSSLSCDIGPSFMPGRTSPNMTLARIVTIVFAPTRGGFTR